jgi:tRNA(adenine34) deaminase
MQIKFEDQLWLMDEALIEAEKAYRSDEVPIGAVIIDSQGTILGRAHNIKEHSNNPCGHAEILAIIDAGEKINNWRLTNCSLFVTLEPCPMCMGAIVQARLSRLYFGAYDKKGGAISLNYNLYKDKRLNHNFEIVGGVKHYESSKLLSRFFKEKRSGYTNL